MPRCFLFDIEPSKTYTAFTAWVGNRIKKIKKKKTPAQARTYAIICFALLWLLFHARHFVLLFPTFDTFAVFFLFFFYLLGTVRSTFRITGFPYSIHIYIRLRCLYFSETHIPWSIFFLFPLKYLTVTPQNCDLAHIAHSKKCSIYIIFGVATAAKPVQL
jgi:hypothetical protein